MENIKLKCQIIVNGQAEWASGEVDIDELGRGEDRFPVLKGTIGFYTGIRDKNNKEVYAGDKVKFYYEGAELVGVIKFVKGSFVVECGKIQYLFYDLDFTWNGTNNLIEVIGNVYEH